MFICSLNYNKIAYKGANMQILTTQALLEKYKNYANPADKIKRESDKENLILLKNDYM